MTDKRIRVLSIEDSPYDARLIQEFLLEAQQLGWDLPRFELEHVDHLEAALARLDKGGLDVVLTDLDLPDSQAQETFVRLHAYAPHMPIVVLTGQESGELARRTVRAGAEDYLFKREMDGSLLAHALIYAVERQQAKQALQTAHGELERRVRTRTAELVQANEDLKREMAQREQADEALRRSQQDLIRAQKLARMGSWRYDVDSQMPAWSEEMFHIFGRDPQKGEPSYLEHQQYIHPQDWARFDVAVNRAVTTGTGYELELRIVRPDGVTRHIITRCEAEEDETGASVRLVGTVQDITDRKQAEEHRAWRAQVDSALATLYRPLITPSVTIQEIAQVILEQAQALTSSQHGYVSSIDPLTGDLVSHTLTEMFGTDCQVSEEHQTIVFPRGKDGRYPGLWGYALNTREAFYTNTPRSHPTATGCPEGHVPLEGFLSVPVLLEKELVGQIALANPEHDYEEQDLEGIQRLAEFYALAIQRQRTEEALEESRENYRRLVENITDVIFTLDTSGHFTYISPVIEQMTDHQVQEIVGQPFTRFVHPDDLSGLAASFEHTLAGERAPAEFRVLDKQGDVRYVRTSSRLLVKDGKVRGLTGIMTDISRQKEVEISQTQSQARLQVLNGISQDMLRGLTTDEIIKRALNRLASLHPKLRVAYCTINAEGQLHCPFSIAPPDMPELEGITADLSTAPTYLEALRSAQELAVSNVAADQRLAPLSEAMEAGRTRAVLDVPVKRWDELVGLLCFDSPVPRQWSEHEIQLLSEVAEQISLAHKQACIERERQDTKKALVESEARYRQLVETSPDSIILTDVAGNILICNQQTAEMHGCKSTAELVGKNVFEFIAPQDRARAREILATALTGVPVKRIEYEALRTDGSRLAVELNASLIKDERGEPRAFIGVTRDVSARKRVARALAHKAKEMEQFANIVSHDLREPLRTVNSFLELLEKQSGDVLDENAQAYLSYAQEGAQRMQKMIQGLLQYARVGTRGGELVPIESETLLEQVLQDLQLKIEDSGATITYDSLPTVMADPLQLGRVFQNLIDNAIKFQRPTEPPRIEVAAQRNGRQWIFSVRDNGIGLKPEQTDRLFQIFQRLHKDQTYEGTGIGLAICRRIVERHAGRIWVDLNPAGGSTFYFTWPADLEPSAEAPTSKKAKPSPSATA